MDAEINAEIKKVFHFHTSSPQNNCDSNKITKY